MTLQLTSVVNTHYGGWRKSDHRAEFYSMKPEWGVGI